MDKRILDGEIIEFFTFQQPDGPEERAVTRVGYQTWEIPVDMFKKAGHVALDIGTRFDVVTPTAVGNWPRSLSEVLPPKLGPPTPEKGE